MPNKTGRAVKSNRGIGGGSNGAKVSSGRAASLPKDFAKKSGGQGGKATPVSVPKDRQPKNMGSAGEKKPGPKYGRDKGSKTY